MEGNKLLSPPPPPPMGLGRRLRAAPRVWLQCLSPSTVSPGTLQPTSATASPVGQWCGAHLGRWSVGEKGPHISLTSSGGLHGGSTPQPCCRTGRSATAAPQAKADLYLNRAYCLPPSIPPSQALLLLRLLPAHRSGERITVFRPLWGRPVRQPQAATRAVGAGSGPCWPGPGREAPSPGQAPCQVIGEQVPSRRAGRGLSHDRTPTSLAAQLPRLLLHLLTHRQPRVKRALRQLSCH